ncbi:cryptochrome/photolyase family protein [Amycolatopsis jiangsuensis]|uniref:Deoxyribodipyrimidine photo-lyase n=1 Tax=Amycolatopsis jiangsuensis TaxID=1181879 RepID=A0A840IQ93_9PSEU|nr:deoxyribodipyrimidine photo-lyase [Amycolatopsis jiangsuensis]MBB4684013.1 deoxyribodipyrimidine photo-lyase [Amycolatopsis jiangsuensis]
MAHTSIALFTRDLRVHDNPVLHAAAAAGQCIPVFVADEAISRSPFHSANRSAFLADCLADLDQALRKRGGHLVVRKGDPVAEVLELVRRHGVDEVHVAGDVSGFAQRRERRLAEAVDLCVHETSVTAVEPLSLTPTGNDHFAVFTPYFRKWQGVPRRGVLRAPRAISMPRVSPGKLPRAPKPDSPELPRGGETTARKLMNRWCRKDILDYESAHDALAADATSRLSPYLHFGALSPVELLDRAGTESEGARAFTRQLAWRDFHHQVLAARPQCSTKDYRPHGDRWRGANADFEAWRRGRTGYPIVDAAMRQLAGEGWMHNRGRLIVGSFLTKNLYLDWRLGARHFMELLVDCDIANNQMNWQWVAGTGTDTRPNRVLNPLAQARRYDPDGDYVRRYVPELAGVAGSRVHEPWKLSGRDRDELDYPEPIVDLDAEEFRMARGKAG